MRNTRQLLELLLKQVEQCPQWQFFGMCGEMNVMVGAHTRDVVVRGCFIWDGEFDKLDWYLVKNEPKGMLPSSYWWKSGEKQPRIDWLKQHIKLN